MRKIWNGEEKTKFERELLEEGLSLIAGVDEVGRGPLAGPVVCAAVIMPLDENSLVEGVDDSKKLSAKKREQLAEEIKSRALCYTIIEIDENGKLSAEIQKDRISIRLLPPRTEEQTAKARANGKATGFQSK